MALISADFLTRIERRALWVTGLLSVAMLIWPGTGPMVAAGVMGGALLGGISYWAIKRGVDGLAGAMVGGGLASAHVARSLTMLVGRYALLALIAYVMISRLRLSPVGLLLGASVIPIAATVEVLAGVRKHGKI